jgi:hypothetical protein
MPKTAKDYSKVSIYKICCKDPSVTEFYIGSTTNFTQRKSYHKHTCCNTNHKFHHYNVYQFIRKYGGWDNWEMIEIECLSLNTSQEVLKKEREWFDNLKPTLNSNRPTRTKEELNQDYVEHYKLNTNGLADKKKAYYYANKEKITEKRKKYYEANREKLLAKKKEYREKIKSNNNIQQQDAIIPEGIPTESVQGM